TVAEPEPEAVEVEHEESAPPREGPHILVAHPDSQLREAARTRLEEIGYRVTTAADGLEGLRRAMAERPDLVVADSSMPKMDGRELCQMLKSQERTAKIKVVLLARSTVDVAGEPGLRPDEILRKPVRFDLLRSSIASLLAHHPS
ncbi:MAG: response regulator, partial [Thermoanaerobaculia bacterium]